MLRQGLIAAFLVVTFTTAVSAATIAGDSFLIGTDPAAGEYEANVPFDGFPAGDNPQNPTVPGFTGPWNNGGTGLWLPVAGGLDHPSISGEAGGAARFQFDTEVGVRNVKRDLTSPPSIAAGQTYWMSGLVSLTENDPDFDGYAYAGFASDLNDNGSTQGLKIGFAGDGSEMDLVLRHRTNGGVIETLTLADGVTLGETYLVVLEAKVDSDEGGPGVLGNDNINIWINPADVNALGAPDVAVEDFSMFTNDAFRYFTLEGSNLTGAGALFDEFYIGDELSDVVTAAVVPEPATLMLWSLLGLGLVGARRFRRRS